MPCKRPVRYQIALLTSVSIPTETRARVAEMVQRRDLQNHYNFARGRSPSSSKDLPRICARGASKLLCFLTLTFTRWGYFQVQIQSMRDMASRQSLAMQKSQQQKSETEDLLLRTKDRLEGYENLHAYSLSRPRTVGREH